MKQLPFESESIVELADSVNLLDDVIQSKCGLIDKVYRKLNINDDTKPDINETVATKMLQIIYPNQDIPKDILYSETPAGITFLAKNQIAMDHLMSLVADTDIIRGAQGILGYHSVDGKILLATYQSCKLVDNKAIVNKTDYEHEERHQINRMMHPIWNKRNQELKKTKNSGESSFVLNTDAIDPSLQNNTKEEVLSYEANSVAKFAIIRMLTENEWPYNYNNILGGKFEELMSEVAGLVLDSESSAKKLSRQINKGLLNKMLFRGKSKQRILYKRMVTDAVNSFEELNTFYTANMKDVDADYAKRFTMGFLDAFHIQDWPQIVRIAKRYSSYNDRDNTNS